MRTPDPPPNKPNLPRHWSFWALLSALLIAISVTGYLIFSSLRLSITTDKSNQAEMAESTSEVEALLESFPQDQNTPLQNRLGPAPKPWDGESRLAILLLGVDDRTQELVDGPPRTDTMILVTIDPETKTGNMLSIPRDLWVEVPDFGYHKINQAYPLGEAFEYRSGGAGLAIETVENFLDVEIPYYILVNFNTFIHLIDEIEGVKITVPERIMVNLGGGKVQWVEPGRQTMPGDIALAYVRARSTSGGDFDRNQRQQLVLRG